MSCTQKKVCISQESDIDIRLGLFLVVQAKKYAYPRNPIPAVAQQEGWSAGFRENLPVPKEKQQFPLYNWRPKAGVQDFAKTYLFLKKNNNFPDITGGGGLLSGSDVTPKSGRASSAILGASCICPLAGR